MGINMNKILFIILLIFCTNLVADEQIFDSESIKIMQLSAEAGNANAQLNLGNLYLKGSYIKRNVYEAEKWYLKAADQGLAIARFRLGLLYALDVEFNKLNSNVEKGKTLIFDAANQGLADAEFFTGIIYYNSNTPQRFIESAEWFKKAAEQGHPQAQLLLGNQLLLGLGVEKDLEEAKKLYFKSAEQGESRAQLKVGHLYFDGMGVDRDYKEAFKWYMLAAKQNEPEAQFKIAGMYEEGIGVHKEYFEAMVWYQKAAEHGYGEAYYRIGTMYFNGLGVQKDIGEAGKWILLAAQKDVPMAQYFIGLMYTSGLGQLQDKIKAHMWFSISSANGNIDAARNRVMLEESMAPYEISESQKLAAEWIKQKTKK